MAEVKISVPSCLCGSPSDAWLFSTGVAESPVLFGFEDEAEFLRTQ